MKFYTVKEIARMLDLNSQTIRAEIKAGHLVATKINSSYIVTPEDLEAYLQYRKDK